MGWLIAKLFKFALLAVLIAIAAFVAFIFLVSPNHYKNQITQIVQNYTGQPFQINGNIEWTLGPRTTVNINDLALAKSADDKNPAIKIKEATIVFDIFALFRKEVTIHNVDLNNVVMDWSLIKTLNKSNQIKGRLVLIQDFALKNGSLTIKDPNDHLNWLMQNVTLTASNVMINGNTDVPPLLLQGDLINVDLSSKYSLDTTVKYDITKGVVTLDPLKVTWNDTPIRGTASIDQIAADPIISGSMTLDPTDVGGLLKKMDPYFANSPLQITHTLQMQTGYSFTTKDQILDLTKLHLQIDKGVLNGDIKLGLVSPYQAQFSLSAENLDFAPLGMLSSALFPSIHTLNAMPIDLIKNISVNGKLSGTQLTINNELVIDQLHMEVNGGSGVVQFTPVIINAYGGTHNMALSIDVSKDKPIYQMTEQADKVELGPWLKAISGTSIISGSASVKANLQATGADLTTITQSLSGTVNLSVSNGVYYGFDANRIMQFATQTVTDIFTELTTSPAANLNVLAIKRSSDWIKTQQDSPKTKFDNLQFNTEIDKGVSQKANLSVANNVIDLKGSGSFTISDKTINFTTTMVDRLDINTNIKVLAGYMKQTPINMTITGTLNKPVFGPDVQSYVTSVLKAGTADLMTQAVNKMVAVTPPNGKTDKTATEIFINSLQSLNK